jgi:hypothetical protein
MDVFQFIPSAYIVVLILPYFLFSHKTDAKGRSMQRIALYSNKVGKINKFNNENTNYRNGGNLGVVYCF